MLDALLTLAAAAFGLWYIYLKTGDAIRAAWAELRPRSVNDNATDGANVLSSSAMEARAEMPVVSTDQTSDRPDQTAQKPKASDEQFLTLFQVFKEAGYSREEARAILRPFSVPVDNNLFSKAPKPSDGRPPDPTVKVPAYEMPPR